MIIESSSDDEIIDDNFNDASDTIEYLNKYPCSFYCEHDDNFLVIAVATPAIVVTADIAIGTAIGAIIATEDSIIPAPAITPDTEYTVTSMTVILLRYFFIFIEYSSASVLSFIENSLTVSYRYCDGVDVILYF